MVKNKFTFYFSPCEFTIGGFWVQTSTVDCDQSKKAVEPPSEAGKRSCP